jgi:hypothetical protein
LDPFTEMGREKISFNKFLMFGREWLRPNVWGLKISTLFFATKTFTDERETNYFVVS